MGAQHMHAPPHMAHGMPGDQQQQYTPEQQYSQGQQFPQGMAPHGMAPHVVVHQPPPVVYQTAPVQNVPAPPAQKEQPSPHAALAGQVQLTDMSAFVFCPSCKRDTHTIVKSNPFTLLNIFLGFCFCLWCVFCIPATAKQIHSCEHCGRVLGANNIV
jgi:hypothetical protein